MCILWNAHRSPALTPISSKILVNASRAGTPVAPFAHRNAHRPRRFAIAARIHRRTVDAAL
jgi:hypothetical protein